MAACAVAASYLSSLNFCFRRLRETVCRLWPDRGGVGQYIKGRVPEEDKTILPGRPQGSHHLPWDKFSIATKTVGVPEVGGWGGELVSTKVADEDFRHGGTTIATAGNLNVSRSCAAGRQPSGNRNAVLALKDASNMPRRSASDGNGKHLSATCRRKATSRRPTAPASPARGHAAKGILKSFAIVPAAMSRYGNLHVRPPRTVTTPAVRP